jgi:hypothetical protein
MKGRRHFLGQRDQHASAFSASLLRLCDAVGAPGAAIVDAEGETVDYAGRIDPFDIKVAAAEWAVVFARIKASRSPLLASVGELRVRGARKSYIVRSLADDYALVLQLVTYSFGVSVRGLDEAIREVSFEAGLPVPLSARGKEQWVRVDVRCAPGAPRRPRSIWINGAWLPVEVLGHWMDAGSRDLGYRTRVDSSVELTLIREPLGRWYAEAPLPF